MGVDELLLEAVRKNNLKSVQYFLEKLAEIKDKKTGLMIAAKMNSKEIAQSSAARRADVSARDKNGLTALMIASQKGYEKVVNMLLKHKHDVDLQNKDGFTALTIASHKGHEKVVKILLEHNPNINFQTNDGWTALTIASQKGHKDIVELLLKHNPNVDLQNKNRFTALMFAIQNGHEKVVEMLLEHNPNVDLQNKDGWTALMIASQKGHEKVVEMLLRHNPNVDLQNKDGFTTLMFAAQHGHKEIVQMLVKKNGVKGQLGIDALMLASIAGHMDVAKILIAKIEELDQDLKKELEDASKKDCLDIIKTLIKQNVNILGSNGRNALITAAYFNKSEIVRILIEKGVNVNASFHDGITALMRASQKGHTEIVRMLVVEYGADVNATASGKTAYDLAANDEIKNILRTAAQGNAVNSASVAPVSQAPVQPQISAPPQEKAEFSGAKRTHDTVSQRPAAHVPSQVLPAPQENLDELLLEAIKKNDKNAVESLLKREASANAKDKDGWTALILASRYGHTEIAQILLDEKADVKIQGHIALMHAILNGHKEIVQMLLRYRHDVDLQNKNGLSALMFAVQHGHKEIVEMLLRHNPDVDLQDRNGWNALMFAARHGHTEIVQMLLRHNPNVDLQDRNGWNALMFAARHGHTEIVEMLLDSGADLELQNDDGHTALELANDEDVKKILRKAKLAASPAAAPQTSATQENFGESFLDAVRKNDVSAAKSLLIRGVYVDFKDKNRRVALMFAASHGHKEIVEMLLEHNPNVDLQSKDGWTALMIAAYHGHKEIVEMLLRHNPNVDLQYKDGWTALMFAAQHGHKEIVEMLLRHNPNVDLQNKDGWTALMIAIHHGHEKVVEMLVKKNGVKGQLGIDALMIASIAGHMNIAKILITKIEDLDQDLKKELEDASERDCLDIVRILIEQDVNISGSNGRNALITAAYFNKSKIMRMLIEKGVNINAAFHKGMTALMIASQEGHTEIAKMLVVIADVNATASGKTAYDLAANDEIKNILRVAAQGNEEYQRLNKLLLETVQDQNSVNAVRHLLSQGADPDFANDGWPTCLMLAIILHDDDTIAKMLIAKMSNVNAEDQDKRTALMVAAENGKVEIVKLLLEKNADITARNKDGKTALDLASDRNVRKILEARELDQDGAAVAGVLAKLSNSPSSSQGKG